MKKILVITALLLIVGGSIFAQGIDIGEFPVGNWVDDTYDAVWEFSSNNIRILDVDGNVYYDFKGKTIKDFKAGVNMDGIAISFYCDETGKTYRIVKPPTNTNLELTIDTDWGVHYEKDLALKL